MLVNPLTATEMVAGAASSRAPVAEVENALVLAELTAFTQYQYLVPATAVVSL